MFGKNEVRLKNWEGTNKDLCTEIRVDVEEFGADGGESRYWVEQERVDLTLPMKEFRVSYVSVDALKTAHLTGNATTCGFAQDLPHRRLLRSNSTAYNGVHRWRRG